MEKSKEKWTLYEKFIWVCTTPPWAFDNVQEEKLYAAYVLRQRQRAVPRLLAAGILLQIFAAIVPGERDLAFAYTSVSTGLTMNCFLAFMRITEPAGLPLLNHLAWFAVWGQLLLSAYRRLGDAYNELLGWALMFQYFTLATMPFNWLALTAYGTLGSTGYIIVQYYNARNSENYLPEDFKAQELANVFLLIAASVLGGTMYVANEKMQRFSFMETKRSLRDKLTIEQQSQEQERLLLSVLPEHVAVQMRKDLGLIDRQFKKIYMSRHENVSILYADIVGFTAISSTYSAQDLVAILNELFARFDRLAEKYQQLRIKILGDCYYCISGAPVERPDHAVLCVHMGLSMVKAIKYVQQTTNSPVDMRVGIHTGAVLAGVLGQRQWQFDVYSRDVELANKMESSGMAGRVHISEVTKSFLNDEFEVEPAHGERREEMLRQAGIKTFFIVRVLKPYQGGEEKISLNGEERDGDSYGSSLPDLVGDDDEDSVLSPQVESKESEEVIYEMLQQELVNRDDDKSPSSRAAVFKSIWLTFFVRLVFGALVVTELAEGTTLCLTFKSSEAEAAFARRFDPYPITVVAPVLIMMPAVMLLNTFALPLSWAISGVFVALVLESGLFNIIYYTSCSYLNNKKKKVSPYWKMICGAFNILMFVAANVAVLTICGSFEAALNDDLHEDAVSHSGARRCYHPSYYYHMGAGALCGGLWVTPLSFAGRVVLLTATSAAFVLPSVLQPDLLVPRPSLDHDPYNIYNTTMECPLEGPFYVLSKIHSARHIITLFFLTIAMLIFHRYTESLERARHSRGQRMNRQAAQAADLRRRNQALIHNVLPPHVARHFMGARHNHRDLYSQSYAEVGVLFASMPNFSEFYSEETVNNQGLECLRFLNEVISDFDLLLEDAKFNKDIIKIKTISSTYMAASGLNPTRQMQPTDGVLVRWAHLACLVEFALELQRVLAAINEQSFNHFVLRMGVNHGPITAGVIGARKPHYDIWGNTVNVASRMESTGKAGCIQVTEETCQILQSFGYFFEQRGLVAVKGKGQLMTYYLQGRDVSYVNTDKPQADPAKTEASASEAIVANGDASPYPVTTQTRARSDVEQPLLN